MENKGINESMIANGGTIKNSTIKGGGNNNVNISIKYYAVASIAGFIGGILASIIANLITG